MTTYESSGVSLSRAAEAMKRIAAAAKSTRTERVLHGVGLFGGFYALDDAADGQVLVASTDGIGTKVLLASQLCRINHLGEDLVHHCINDLLVCGARPLFFLDYLAFGKLEPDVAGALAESLARGCRAHGVALIGGETAEMPGLYAEGHFDVAGTIVGMVRRDQMLDGSRVKAGDVMLGLPSVSPHTNGYSLIRRILEPKIASGEIESLKLSNGEKLAEAVLAPHKCYLPIIEPLLKHPGLHAMSHITGGGLVENTERVLREGQHLIVDWTAWKLPELFAKLQEWGEASDEEMRRVFNVGIGLVLIVDAKSADEIDAKIRACNEDVIRIGRVEA